MGKKYRNECVECGEEGGQVQRSVFLRRVGKFLHCAIPEKKILIEADGDYWHGNEKKYPVLNEVQKKHVEMRVRKRVAMKWVGLRLVEVWESDMTHRREDIIDMLRGVLCG